MNAEIVAAVTNSRELAGVAVAVGSASLYNVGYVLEKQALNRTGGTGARSLFATAVRSRRWLAGFAAMVGGLLLQVLALTMAPVSVVQPVLAGGLVALAVIGSTVLDERLGWRERCALAMVLVAVVAIALSARTGPVLAHHNSGARFAALALPVALVGGLSTWLGLRRASHVGSALAGAAVGAGVMYGLGAVAEKAIATTMVDHGLWQGAWRSLASPYPWLFVVFTLAGLVSFQMGLQRYPASMMATFANVTSSVCALAGASIVFGELLVPGGWWSLARLTGFVSVLAAVTVLAGGGRQVPTRAPAVAS